MADIVGGGATSVGGLSYPITGILGRIEYWRPVIETPDAWVSSGTTAILSTSFSSWIFTNSEVQLQVAEDVAFASIIHDTELTQAEDVIDGRLVSGLTDGELYYLRARVKETTPSGYNYVSPWTPINVFSVVLESGGAYAYLTTNVGVEITRMLYWSHYGYENVGIQANQSERFWSHYAYENVGVEYTPSGHVPQYIFQGDVSTDTPLPRIWFLQPSFGRPGDGIRIIGQGFGDLQTTYSGTVEIDMGGDLGWQNVPVTSWQTFPPTDDAYTGDREIDELLAQIDPQHTIIEIVVPAGALPPGHAIRVRTDGA